MKDDHKKFPGFSLWTECIKGNPEAWEEMKEYNKADVVSLEALYLHLRPFMRHHPNVGRPEGESKVLCPKCGSDHFQYRGYYYSKAGLSYRKFQCNDCGGWGREPYSEKDEPRNLGRNAV
jgi:hypothetical protein